MSDQCDQCDQCDQSDATLDDEVGGVGRAVLDDHWAGVFGMAALPRGARYSLPWRSGPPRIAPTT